MRGPSEEPSARLESGGEKPRWRFRVQRLLFILIPLCAVGFYSALSVGVFKSIDDLVRYPAQRAGARCAYV